MIVVTGAAGFIGSRLIHALNAEGYTYLVAVDIFDNPEKEKNLQGAKLLQRVDRRNFLAWLDQNEQEVEFIFHLGARTDTTEFDYQLLWELNTDYSKALWQKCTAYQIPLVYASSAATYGAGELGYKDEEALIPQLKPLNPYGESKNEFDKWVLQQQEAPFFWAGLKFFNVYGWGENHKGRMASVIWHAYRQIQETGRMRLFRSHHPDFKDGEQMRDFVYVEDVARVCLWLMHHRQHSGIYNLGSGKARTFRDLVTAVFSSLQLPAQIEFIDTPADIRDTYQYFTEADMGKLKGIGYPHPFTELEEGVRQYVARLESSRSAS
ncbi:ADP-glyceromanno-heptose 6-epimerase [Cesiribacter andamanensis]|uniref:ADP-L-glycero-D-manno-heptose-6-epimerase n=1 Tax=Cesiribacter andamanensis AMV16 TaxID=1279009 RepID=M7NNS0_9BACT|nr:ADP-glyceromanno-heptose 6-epimerase [Cesiribacter andamanensis]EMR03360.1 ADP-L-glycero-D-manno-heptose-6-epimerase [Cesiribacter andamanensis AMV16]